MPSLERLVAGELTIEPKVDPDGETLDLFWNGRSTDRQPGRLILPYVNACLDAGLVLRMHFETIDHMNSSTITTIIQIIQEARTRKAKLVIWFDPKKKWQKLSFDALRVFVRDDGCLELVGKE